MLQRNAVRPHEGRELSLMLAGRKKFAIFSEEAPSDEAFARNSVPEQIYAPYVARGRIVRLDADIWHAKLRRPIRYVCYTLPGSEWRAQAFFWIRREIYGGRRQPDPSDDVMIARLLGYSMDEVEAFRSAFAGAAALG
ncbi:MAG: hypothetical protein EOM26_12480 [Alphaproteobacteria bacterium]|nr:hypothetical protein [Alphaproteobacteria bacterium]